MTRLNKKTDFKNCFIRSPSHRLADDISFVWKTTGGLERKTTDTAREYVAHPSPNGLVQNRVRFKPTPASPEQACVLYAPLRILSDQVFCGRGTIRQSFLRTHMP